MKQKTFTRLNLIIAVACPVIAAFWMQTTKSPMAWVVPAIVGFIAFVLCVLSMVLERMLQGERSRASAGASE